MTRPTIIDSSTGGSASESRQATFPRHFISPIDFSPEPLARTGGLKVSPSECAYFRFAEAVVQRTPPSSEPLNAVWSLPRLRSGHRPSGDAGWADARGGGQREDGQPSIGLARTGGLVGNPRRNTAEASKLRRAHRCTLSLLNPSALGLASARSPYFA
jgi:hypothetical protein